MPDTTHLWTVETLAAAHDLSKDTVYDWLKSGELRGFKLGVEWRIHPDDWAEFIDRKRGLLAS